VRAARLLVLAGTDRLDKELMIGQMQGKFQMEVVPDVGHMLHEVSRLRSRDGRDVDAPPGQPAQDCGDIGRVLEEERTSRDWHQEGWRVVGRCCQAAKLVILSDGSIHSLGLDRDRDNDEGSPSRRFAAGIRDARFC